MRLPALAAREGNFSPPVPTGTATHINGMGAIVSAERAAMSFNRRFSSSSLSSKRKPSGWSAWSVIDEAAELIGGNGPVDPMLAEALGQAPPEVLLAANLERDGVHWAWQLDYIDSQQWDSFGASLEMQCAIKDVLARARNVESCESAESLRRGVAPTPALPSALFLGEALRSYDEACSQTAKALPASNLGSWVAERARANKHQSISRGGMVESLRGRVRRASYWY